MKIKDIQGNNIKVTDVNKAIKQCKLCQKSSFIMESGHTVGENHSFMLRQLVKLKMNQRTEIFSPSSFLGEPDAKEKKQKTISVKNENNSRKE